MIPVFCTAWLRLPEVSNGFGPSVSLQKGWRQIVRQGVSPRLGTHGLNRSRLRVRLSTKPDIRPSSPVGDVRALAAAIADLLRHPQLVLEMGRAGRERAEREFRPQRIWTALLEEYSRLLRERGLPTPQKTGSSSRVISGGATVTAS